MAALPAVLGSSCEIGGTHPAPATTPPYKYIGSPVALDDGCSIQKVGVMLEGETYYTHLYVATCKGAVTSTRPGTSGSKIGSRPPDVTVRKI